MKTFKQYVSESTIKPLYAWMEFHQKVERSDVPEDIVRNIKHLLGSDFGGGFSEREWQKALSSAPHMRTYLYKAMKRKYGEDPTGGMIYS